MNLILDTVRRYYTCRTQSIIVIVRGRYFTQALRVFLALVCGMSPAQRENHAILVLQAHIDDSTSDGQVLVLAGFISTAIKWAEFTIESDEHLRLANMKEFKMAEMGMNETEITASFYRIAEKHALGVLATASPDCVTCEGCGRIQQSCCRPEPLHLRVQCIVSLCAQYQRDMGLNEPIDFIFDEKIGEDSVIHQAWKFYVNSVPDEDRQVTGSMPIFRKSYIVKPIQAADLIAWWFRRMFLKTGKMSGWPYDWTEKKKLAWMTSSFSEEDFRDNFVNSISLIRPKRQLTVGFTLNGKKV